MADHVCGGRSRGPIIAVCAALSLIGGGTYAFATNVLLNTPCDASCSADGRDTSFRKPWFAAFCVLFVQAVANSIALAVVRSNSVKPSSTPSSSVSVFHPSMRVPMAVISLLDVCTVFLQSLASLYIPAAVNGAMRGTLLLLTALMSRALRIFDGRAGRAEWAGIVVSTLGALGVGAVHVAGVAFPLAAQGDGGSSPPAAAAVAAAAAVSGFAATSTADAAVGVLLSLLSNVSLALGIAWETKVFEKRKPSMLALNATRTIAGSAIMLVAMAAASFSPPARDHGALEAGGHTACCVWRTPAVAGFAFTVGAGASISGISALYLSALAGSNFRAVVYVGRALWVWVLELITYYGGNALTDPFARVYGRPWNRFSYPMAVGFLLVVVGGAVTWRGRSRRIGAVGGAPGGEGEDVDEDDDGGVADALAGGAGGAASLPSSSSRRSSAAAQAQAQAQAQQQASASATGLLLVQTQGGAAGGSTAAVAAAQQQLAQEKTPRAQAALAAAEAAGRGSLGGLAGDGAAPMAGKLE